MGVCYEGESGGRVGGEKEIVSLTGVLHRISDNKIGRGKPCTGGEA